MGSYYKSKIKEKLDVLFNSGELKGKRVIAFGHCNATEEMVDYLLLKGVNTLAILDNNENKQGSFFKSSKIVPPEYIEQFKDSEVTVLIASRFFEPMSAQLKDLGFKGEIIKVLEYNTFQEYSLADDVVKRRLDRMLRGSKTIRSLRDRFPEEYLVVCPNNALGDVYWACAFLPEYCVKNGIDRVVIAVIGNGCAQVAKMFGHVNVVNFGQEEMDELVQSIIFNHEENCIIAHHDRPYTDNIIKYLDGHFLSFIDYYKYAVFALTENARHVVPMENKEFEGKDDLVRGKSVIIAPYAKSVVEAPSVFWDGLIDDYIGKGYRCYTYVFGDERPLENTIRITSPINQLVSLVEYAGYFVGLRSGLCDIIHSADCHKTLVMPDCIYSTTDKKVADFFHLPGWREIIV